ncbi:hypothetical protein GGX14DRAFT_403404 [Mycena pura]|uniref:Uncharacterized protein n=1 Tax=Mycena pura TaxID=153505 RepID=A0AAD6Y6A0_9AGAR|nr:hypothetical protein GGX14DRAFT_403404 [Mycena pura]
MSCARHRARRTRLAEEDGERGAATRRLPESVTAAAALLMSCSARAADELKVGTRRRREDRERGGAVVAIGRRTKTPAGRKPVSARGRGSERTPGTGLEVAALCVRSSTERFILVLCPRARALDAPLLLEIRANVLIRI